MTLERVDTARLNAHSVPHTRARDDDEDADGERREHAGDVRCVVGGVRETRERVARDARARARRVLDDAAIDAAIDARWMRARGCARAREG